MSDRWYDPAVIYSIEVESFQDSDGDGCGDLPGLVSRLDYLSRLGVTCLWLSPIHPSPWRDDGYDVADYYGVHPKFGSLGDFAELTLQARERGIRILLDLVVNHTSDECPWFRSACADAGSPFRDWYVWSADEPPDRRQGMVFPGEQTETWTWDEQAQAWYYHRFYDFQPDLNWANPAVREEIRKVMGFWLQLGASGFRVDAAPFVLELVQPGVDPPPQDFTILDRWRQETQWRDGASVLLLEANVDADRLPSYVASTKDGPNDRAQLLFDFILNGRLWLALARQDAEPVVETLRDLPALPLPAQWATFLRNHDELDLSRLTDEQRNDVFRAFGAQRRMQLYDRGIRRRLAPMLGGDGRRIRLAYALLASMPGCPVLRYGDEIGMGEDLGLPGRNAIRTPMQWEDTPGAGFSAAPDDQLVRPLVRRGPYGFRTLNVRAQRQDEHSLLRWFEQLLGMLRECPEVALAPVQLLDVPLPRAVLAHRYPTRDGSLVLLHNLGSARVRVDLALPEPVVDVDEVFAEERYVQVDSSLASLELRGYGYRWFRVRTADRLSGPRRPRRRSRRTP